MGVDFALTLLPALCPEPALVGRDRQGGTQLENTVLAFDHLQLRAGLVQVQAEASAPRSPNWSIDTMIM